MGAADGVSLPMVFSSHLFIYWFLPLTLGLYLLAPRPLRHLGLTLLSYAFYGWANPAFTLLMAASTLVDYVCGLAMAGASPIGSEEPRRLEPGGDRSARQRVALTVSIVSNLTLLGFFKYFNFALDNYSSLVAWLGLDGLGAETALRVALPLGISFYTFQSMSYSVDVFRGDARALKNLVDFACYVSMFPQLVAGPIIRFSEIAAQLRHRSHTIEKVSRGAALFSLGCAKKILLANPCGKIADTLFDAGSVLPLDAWYGATAYAFQIYFDFSGYSDMAIGLGLLLGFVFPKNFDSPYKSESITEFWRRWHQSLSSWLRDYLYFPLGGSRRGAVRTYLNLSAVMLLGGLWHGAAWNFVVWGGLHGVLLAAERARGKRGLFDALPRAARVGGTFLLVLVGWVFFRAPDLSEALRYLGAMVGFVSPAPAAALAGGLVYAPYYLSTFVLAGVVAFAMPQAWDWTRRLAAWKALLCALLLWTALGVLATQSYNPFIYFLF